jgi:hypothetical protein
LKWTPASSVIGRPDDRFARADLGDDLVDCRSDDAASHRCEPDVGEADPVLPVARADHGKRRVAKLLGPVGAVPADGPLRRDGGGVVDDVVGGRGAQAGAVPCGLDRDAVTVEAGDREAHVDGADHVAIGIGHGERHAGPIGVAGAGPEGSRAAEQEAVAVGCGPHPAAGAGGEADPLVPFDDAAE